MARITYHMFEAFQTNRDEEFEEEDIEAFQSGSKSRWFWFLALIVFALFLVWYWTPSAEVRQNDPEFYQPIGEQYLEPISVEQEPPIQTDQWGRRVLSPDELNRRFEEFKNQSFFMSDAEELATWAENTIKRDQWNPRDQDELMRLNPRDLGNEIFNRLQLARNAYDNRELAYADLSRLQNRDAQQIQAQINEYDRLIERANPTMIDAVIARRRN